MKFRNVNNLMEEMSCDNVKRIVIYNDGVILFDLRQGYFEEYTTNKNGLFSSVYSGRPEIVNLSALPVRAIKENLNRKDNFYKKEKSEYSWDTDGIAVYIHASDISAIHDGEKLAMQNKDEKNYLDAYTLTFTHGAIMKRTNVERIENTPDWIIPEGCSFGDGYGPDETHARYCLGSSFLDKGKEYIYKRWFTHEILYTMETKTGPYCRMEESDERKERRRIAEAFNASLGRDKLSHYDIERLQAVCDIKLKDVKR